MWHLLPGRFHPQPSPSSDRFACRIALFRLLLCVDPRRKWSRFQTWRGCVFTAIWQRRHPLLDLPSSYWPSKRLYGRMRSTDDYRLQWNTIVIIVSCSGISSAEMNVRNEPEEGSSLGRRALSFNKIRGVRCRYVCHWVTQSIMPKASRRALCDLGIHTHSKNWPSETSSNIIYFVFASQFDK